MKIINPYLTFNGTCEEAFTFYKSVFGGEFAAISRFSDVPPGTEMEVSEEDLQRIMHVALPIGDGTVLMGSDTPSNTGAVTQGNTVSISVHPDSEEEAREVFRRLSDGGMVTMPLEKAFWNALFGMCVDRFGVSWMVNYDFNDTHG